MDYSNLNLSTNELWDNFYLPQDKITKEYINVLKKYENRLPANFYYYKEIKESFGLPILELKKKYIQPIKDIVLFSKLIKGEYHTSKSKSDSVIAKSIKWMTTYLPSFKKYQDVDDLSYIIKNHRLLTLEIFKYYAEYPKISFTTIESRFVAILRIFYIAYGNNNTSKQYDLYKKISLIMVNLHYHHKQDEDKMILNEREDKAFVPFNIILGKQKQLESAFNNIQNKTSKEAYKLNQDLLLVSLYSIGPILRDEAKELKYTTEQQKQGNYIYIKDDDVIMDLLDIKKKHKAIYYNLTEEYSELARLLKESYDLYKRDYVFTAYDNINLQASKQILSKRLIKIFSFTGKNIGTNSIRSSYYTYKTDMEKLTTEQKKKIAETMRTSVKYLDEAYNKKLSNSDDVKKEVIIINEREPIKETNRYLQQLERNRKYYNENKEKVLERHKNNYENSDKEILKRKKILYYLNNDVEYINRIKKSTMEKYNIKEEDGKYS